MAKRTLITIIAAQFICSAIAFAQDTRFEPVEQGVADRSPMSISMRNVEVGLRQPVDFEHVYRLPGLLRGEEDRFARISGGIYAVFPQSAYGMTRQGEVALIPAGTVFYIGAPTDALALPPSGLTPAPPLPGSLATPSLGLRVDNRVGVNKAFDAPLRRASFFDLPQRPGDMVVARPPDAPPLAAPGTMIGDDDYRRERMMALMQRAIEAESSEQE